MTDYHRARVPGATWFFTVALAERHGKRLLVERIDGLRSAFRAVRAAHPFRLDAVVVLPDHLHCVWSLPGGERRSARRARRGERGIWQRRFWEHCLRDEEDYVRHVDYIHWNPVKHGYVQRVAEWPYSSFHHHVAHGVYAPDWGGVEGSILAGAGPE